LESFSVTDLLPSVFIGSSSEGLDVAREIELQLQQDSLTTIWKDAVFGLGGGTLESLMNVLDQFDFAVMVLSPDDLIESRQMNFASPRDNVVFELGLFMGRLGRSRTFIVHERDTTLKIPSDLAGIALSPYRRRDNLSAALSPTCTPIIKAIRSLGPYEGRANAQFSRATHTMEGAAAGLSHLTRRLIQSRILELKIVERRMPTDERKEVEKDRKELEALLAQSG
jgi:hypothetical protein